MKKIKNSENSWPIQEIFQKGSLDIKLQISKI